jgi:hypothetical protein
MSTMNSDQELRKKIIEIIDGWIRELKNTEGVSSIGSEVTAEEQGGTGANDEARNDSK